MKKVWTQVVTIIKIVLRDFEFKPRTKGQPNAPKLLDWKSVNFRPKIHWKSVIFICFFLLDNVIFTIFAAG